MAVAKKKTTRKAPAKKATAKKKRKPKAGAKPATPSEFLKGLKGTASEDTGFRFLSDSIFMEARKRLPTGVLALDKLSGGGWPEGTLIEIAAWEGIGKSTLLDQSMAQVQRMGGTAAVIDTEGARDLGYMELLGVDPETVIHMSAYTIEECFTRIDELLNRQEELASTGRPLAPLFIVWDSIGGTPAKAEAEGGSDANHMAVGAKRIKQNLRRIMLRLPDLRACLVVTNHFYKELGPFGALQTPGGSGLRYFPHLRVRLMRKGQVKSGLRLIGHEVECQVKKTRLGPMPPHTKAGLIYGSGFDNSYTLFDWALENGEEAGHKWVTQRGAWYSLVEPGEEPVTFQHGFVGFGALMNERPELYQKLVARYLGG
jgi:recombination protein RecA